MNTNTFSLENGKRLEVISERGWKNVSVKLDNELIATIPNPRDIKAGKDIQLPDGGILNLHVFQSKLLSSSTSLQVLVNGKRIKDSGTEDEIKYKDATGCVFTIAILSLLFGLFFFSISPFSGFITIGAGVLYLALGYFVKQKSETALIIAIAAYTLDTLIFVVNLAGQGASGRSVIGGLAIRILALSILIPGVTAIKNMKQSSE
jgi:hypothetical protein